MYIHIEGLAQDCGNSTANRLELPTFFVKSTIQTERWINDWSFSNNVYTMADIYIVSGV